MKTPLKMLLGACALALAGAASAQTFPTKPKIGRAHV